MTITFWRRLEQDFGEEENSVLETTKIVFLRIKRIAFWGRLE